MTKQGKYFIWKSLSGKQNIKRVYAEFRLYGRTYICHDSWYGRFDCFSSCAKNITETRSGCGVLDSDWGEISDINDACTLAMFILHSQGKAKIEKAIQEAICSRRKP